MGHFLAFKIGKCMHYLFKLRLENFDSDRHLKKKKTSNSFGYVTPDLL